MKTITRSIFADVRAPAPRYLMRLARIQRLVATYLPEEIGAFLEIGPGTGDVSRFLLDVYPRAKGTLVDISDEAIKEVTSRFRDESRARVLKIDHDELPDDTRFDLIVACEVLEHIEDDAGMLAKIAAQLNPGGVLICSAPAFMRKWQRVDEYAGHVRRYERTELADKLARAGFETLRIETYGFPITNLVFPLRQLYYAMHRGPTEKLQATMNSGVDRAMARKLPTWLVVALLGPAFALQSLALDSDLGDGFIAVARR